MPDEKELGLLFGRIVGGALARRITNPNVRYGLMHRDLSEQRRELIMRESVSMSLLDSLRGSFDQPLSDLDEAQRLRAEKAFYPLRWDDLAPNQRETLARQLDYVADPANEAERQRDWDLECQIGAVEKQFKDLKDTDPKSVTEIATKRQLVAELTEELSVLKSRRAWRIDEQAAIIVAVPSTDEEIAHWTAGPKRRAERTTGLNLPVDADERTDYRRWLTESAFDGRFRRPDFEAFNRELMEFVCCYPDVDKAAVARNRERIEDAVVEVVCEDVVIDETDVPQHALDAFRSKFSEAAARLPSPLPEDNGMLNLLVWEGGFPGDWRPEASPDGKQLLWEGFGYACWIDAAGAATWQGPRFVPGKDYDSSFRGIEMSSGCGLNMVCALAGFRNQETGRRLNPELYLKLCELGFGEEEADERDESPTNTSSAVMPSATHTHRIRRRDDALGPVVRLAQQTAVEPGNYLSVWSQLLILATSDNPPAPIVGHNPDDAICWNDSDGVTQSFTKDALRMRLGRAQKKTATKSDFGWNPTRRVSRG